MGFLFYMKVFSYNFTSVGILSSTMSRFKPSCPSISCTIVTNENKKDFERVICLKVFSGFISLCVFLFVSVVLSHTGVSFQLLAFVY